MVKKMVKEGRVLVHGVLARSVSIKVPLHDKSAVSVASTTPLQGGAMPNAGRTSTHGTEADAGLPHAPCLVFHKPCGMICTTTPDENSSTLVNISPPVPPNFHAVGRLDQHSHGLLLFSSDGRLTSALLSPKSKINREYTVIVKGDVGLPGSAVFEKIKTVIATGVDTDYGTFKGEVLNMNRDVDVDYVHASCKGDRSVFRNDRRDHSKGSESIAGKQLTFDSNQILSSVTISVEEGKKRMVRRLFSALNLLVLDLKRNQYGEIKLNNLEVGTWQFVKRQNEVTWCKRVMEQWHEEGKSWDIDDNSLM